MRTMGVLQTGAVLCFIICAGLAGCGGQSTGAALDASSLAPGAASPAPVQDAQARAGSFSLSVDPASFLDGEPRGSFSLQLDGAGNELTARVHVAGADGLRALYCELAYDAAQYTPVSAEPTALLGGDDELLKLAVLDEPGVVHFGALKAHWDEGAGVSGNGVVAEMRFKREPFTAGASRGVSGALASDAVKPYLFMDYGARRLKWTYYYPGDYNQDGRVTPSDLMPLGQHWEERLWYDEDNLPFERKLGYVIDGNRDRLITIQDIIQISRHFGEGVESFRLYASANPDADWPATPGATPTIASLAEVPMITAQGEAGKEPVYFEQLLPALQEGCSYWVRPVDGGAHGTPSEAVLYDTTVLDGFSYGIQPETYLGDGQLDSLELSFGADGQNLAVDVTMKGAVNLHFISADVYFDPAQFDLVDALGADFEVPGSKPLSYTQMVDKCTGRILVSHHALPGENGFSGDWNCFRLFFSREPQPAVPTYVIGVEWVDVAAEYNELTQLLTWYYANLGDMDQDGTVLVDDFIQLARFWQMGDGEGFNPASIQYMVDADGNGWINIADVATIGWYHHNTVTGYNIYAATDPEDAPSGANWVDYPTPPVEPIGSVTLADDALGELFEERLHFSFRIDNPEPGMWLWVQPTAEGQLGGVPDEGAVVQIPE